MYSLGLIWKAYPRIAEKLEYMSCIYGFEKNLEIFRLSLFTVEYTILGQKGAIFSIMDDTIDIEKNLRLFRL